MHASTTDVATGAVAPVAQTTHTSPATAEQAGYRAVEHLPAGTISIEEAPGQGAAPELAANIAYRAALAAMDILGKAAEAAERSSDPVTARLAVADGYRHLAHTLGERGHAIVPPRPTN